MSAYFKDGRAAFGELCEYINHTFPIMGSLKVDSTLEKDGNRTITFLEWENIREIVPEQHKHKVPEEIVTIILSLTLDENKRVVFIEHNFQNFTMANKELVYFLGSLIGKEITGSL